MFKKKNKNQTYKSNFPKHKEQRDLTYKLLLNVIPESICERPTKLSQEFVDFSNWLNLLYENIEEKKINLMIVKGYYDAQFKLYLNLVVGITLIIACSNLAIGVLNNEIPNNQLTITEIIIGILGIIVATFANSRDNKDDLVHELLTATNKCNEFLSLCEIELSKLVQLFIEQNQITLEFVDKDILTEYKNTYDTCEKTFNTFGRNEAKVLMNGPVSLVHLPAQFPIFRFDPYYLKVLLLPNKRHEYLKKAFINNNCHNKKPLHTSIMKDIDIPNILYTSNMKHIVKQVENKQKPIHDMNDLDIINYNISIVGEKLDKKINHIEKDVSIIKDSHLYHIERDLSIVKTKIDMIIKDEDDDLDIELGITTINKN